MLTLTSSSLPNGTFSENTEIFTDNKQDKLFTKLLVLLLGLYLIFGLVIPMIERTEIPRELIEKVPVQLTRVMLKEKEEEIIPPTIIEEEPEAELEIDTPEKDKPKTKREEAKEKAKTSGLAAMKDDLFSLRDAFIVKPKSELIVENKSAEVEKVKRNLLAAKANEQSKNIVSAQVTKTVASDELSTRNMQTVRLSKEEVLANTIESEEDSIGLDSTRSEMKLRQTLEANKSRLYSLYNRSLRKNPFLKGKVLFEIEIQPSGIVSKVKVKSSELNDKALEKRLTSILKSIDFADEDVSVITTIWAIEFLPR
jgi:hypothetical protein